jgi:hypothetical protein
MKTRGGCAADDDFRSLAECIGQAVGDALHDAAEARDMPRTRLVKAASAMKFSAAAATFNC